MYSAKALKICMSTAEEAELKQAMQTISHFVEFLTFSDDEAENVESMAGDWENFCDSYNELDITVVVKNKEESE